MQNGEPAREAGDFSNQPKAAANRMKNAECRMQSRILKTGEANGERSLAIPARWSHHLNCLALDWTLADRLMRLRVLMRQAQERLISETDEPQSRIEFFTAAGQAKQLKMLMRFHRGWRQEFLKTEGGLCHD